MERGIDLRMRMRVASTGATGGLKRNLTDLADAQDMARSIDDTARQGLLAIHRGYAANMLRDAALAIDQSHRAEELADRLEDQLLAIEARVLRAQALDYSGRPNQVAALIANDFEYLASEVRHDTLGQTMIRSVVAGAHLSMAAAAMGRFDESVRYEDEATAIANEAGRPFDQMYMWWARGFRLDFEGAPAESVAAHQESVAIAEEHDLWFMTTFAQPWMGHALIRAGRPDEALHLLRRLESGAQRVELPYVEALSQAFAAQACQAMGDLEATRAHAATALAFHDEFPNPIIELVARTALGHAAAGTEDAENELAAAAALARANGYEPWLVELEAGRS